LIVTIVFTIVSGVAGVIYIVDYLGSPFLITIPTNIFWAIIIVSLIIIFSFISFHLKRKMSIQWIEGIQGYVFFPKGTLEEHKTLDFHTKHFHHKLIINHKTKPSNAYYMTAPDSYGWKFVNKYHRWVSEIVSREEYSIDDPNFTREWCKEKGYKLNPWDATKKNLLETRVSEPQIVSKLKGRRLNDLEIEWLYPWYSGLHTRMRKHPPRKRLLRKFSTKETFKAPDHDIELTNNNIISKDNAIMRPWDSVERWSKRQHYNYVKRRYSEDELMSEKSS